MYYFFIKSIANHTMSKRKAPSENPNSEFCDFLHGKLVIISNHV